MTALLASTATPSPAWAAKTIPVPMTVGHEYVGVVEAMGEEVRGLRIGQRVSGEGHIVCGHCRNCRAGRRHLCRNTQGVGVNRAGAYSTHVLVPDPKYLVDGAGIDEAFAATLACSGLTAYSAAAKARIESLGGVCEIVGRTQG